MIYNINKIYLSVLCLLLTEKMFSINANEISHAQFVEKYKLIPKQLRLKYLEFLRQMPYLYDDDDKLDIFDDLMLILFWYDHEDACNNYQLLSNTLRDDVYAGHCQVYYDVIGCLLRYLQWQVPMITQKDVLEFRKKMVVRQIREEVAYRPGKCGYEKAFEHFMTLSR
jgi:hypothetical protein